MSKIDLYLIDKAQTAYLWLLDYTGIYLSTVWFILLVLDLGVPALFKEHAMGSLIILGLFGIYCAVYYMLQEKKRYALMNKIAREFQEDFMRPILILVSLPIIVGYAAAGREWYWDAISLVFACTFFYFKCVQIREREPKEWFKASVPASASSS